MGVDNDNTRKWRKKWCCAQHKLPKMEGQCERGGKTTSGGGKEKIGVDTVQLKWKRKEGMT